MVDNKVDAFKLLDDEELSQVAGGAKPSDVFTEDEQVDMLMGTLKYEKDYLIYRNLSWEIGTIKNTILQRGFSEGAADRVIELMQEKAKAAGYS